MPTARSFSLSNSQPQQQSSFYKKHNMSLTQTYYLAHTARSKLSKEASRSEYDLRVLVGHANLLDGLMLELAQAEREQESWFNESVRKAEATAPSTPARISWADTLPPVLEDSDSDDEDEMSDEDEEMIDAEPVVVRKRAPSPHYSSIVTEMEVDSDEEEDSDVAEDDDSDSDELALTRTSSRSSLPSPTQETPDSPPELCHESSDDEEDEQTPPSPPSTVFTTGLGLKGKPTNQVQLKNAEDWTSSRTPELYV